MSLRLSENKNSLTQMTNSKLREQFDRRKEFVDAQRDLFFEWWKDNKPVGLDERPTVIVMYSQWKVWLACADSNNTKATHAGAR